MYTDLPSSGFTDSLLRVGLLLLISFSDTSSKAHASACKDQMTRNAKQFAYLLLLKKDSALRPERVHTNNRCGSWAGQPPRYLRDSCFAFPRGTKLSQRNVCGTCVKTFKLVSYAFLTVNNRIRTYSWRKETIFR